MSVIIDGKRGEKFERFTIGLKFVIPIEMRRRSKRVIYKLGFGK